MWDGGRRLVEATATSAASFSQRNHLRMTGGWGCWREVEFAGFGWMLTDSRGKRVGVIPLYYLLERYKRHLVSAGVPPEAIRSRRLGCFVSTPDDVL